jgi:hypothetical protein
MTRLPGVVYTIFGHPHTVKRTKREYKLLCVVYSTILGHPHTMSVEVRTHQLTPISTFLFSGTRKTPSQPSSGACTAAGTPSTLPAYRPCGGNWRASCTEGVALYSPWRPRVPCSPSVSPPTWGTSSQRWLGVRRVLQVGLVLYVSLVARYI